MVSTFRELKAGEGISIGEELTVIAANSGGGVNVKSTKSINILSVQVLEFEPVVKVRYKLKDSFSLTDMILSAELNSQRGLIVAPYNGDFYELHYMEPNMEVNMKDCEVTMTFTQARQLDLDEYNRRVNG